ncbi:MAG: 2OG-Fe(II) oxygenase, partial [Pseudomonadota bacterium]
MSSTAATIAEAFKTSVANAKTGQSPYPHWFLDACVPNDCVTEFNTLPFPAPALDGVSGKRELHNATRTYFDAENQQRFPSVRAFAEAYQHPDTTQFVKDHFKTDISGCYLRLEYAQDVDGFWLEPHTDLGVKLFTMLLYLSDGPGHGALGTDIYDADKGHVGRSPFAPGSAMVFVPSDVTYH